MWTMNQSQNSTSTTDSDPREKVKDCCRKLIAFMCTQVGVGGLIVSYAIFGAFSFISVETQEENYEVIFVSNLHNETALKLWNVLVEYNTFDQIVTKAKIDNLLISLQNSLVQAHKRGYDGRSVHEIWNFPAALMFSLSVFTMIGYGNMVPRTDWGKVLTMLYAVFGIPLYILYFMNMGKILADTFRWFYTYLYNCARERSKNPEGHRVIVPSTACLWVMGVYVMIGSIMFAEWEGWNYLDSTYFCVTSLCKIGIGDFVPGVNILEAKTGDKTKLIINFIYILLGMGLIAMCYKLMKEEVQIKVAYIKEDIRQCLHDIKMGIFSFVKNCFTCNF